MEKYISFSLGGLQFIDSLNFLQASLDSLVNNLPKNAFVHTKELAGMKNSETCYNGMGLSVPVHG